MIICFILIKPICVNALNFECLICSELKDTKISFCKNSEEHCMCLECMISFLDNYNDLILKCPFCRDRVKLKNLNFFNVPETDQLNVEELIFSIDNSSVINDVRNRLLEIALD